MVALFTPLGDRLRSWSTRRFSGSGLAIHVEADPAKIDLSYLTVHRIDDHGEPFTTVGWRGRQGATWSLGSWRHWPT